MFVDLVEIDPATWAVCILASPMIMVLDQAPRAELEITLCAVGWLSVVFYLCLGAHIYRIYGMLTPELPTDPLQILDIFVGTSAIGLRSGPGQGGRQSVAP